MNTVIRTSEVFEPAVFPIIVKLLTTLPQELEASQELCDQLRECGASRRSRDVINLFFRFVDSENELSKSRRWNSGKDVEVLRHFQKMYNLCAFELIDETQDSKFFSISTATVLSTRSSNRLKRMTNACMFPFLDVCQCAKIITKLIQLQPTIGYLEEIQHGLLGMLIKLYYAQYDFYSHFFQDLIPLVEVDQKLFAFTLRQLLLLTLQLEEWQYRFEIRHVSSKYENDRIRTMRAKIHIRQQFSNRFDKPNYLPECSMDYYEFMHKFFGVEGFQEFIQEITLGCTRGYDDRIGGKVGVHNNLTPKHLSVLRPRRPRRRITPKRLLTPIQEREKSRIEVDDYDDLPDLVECSDDDD